MPNLVPLADRRAAAGSPVPVVDEGLILELAASLDLRTPNTLALATIAHRLSDHYAGGAETSFEGVVDAATGVGKTFIMAAAIDYLAQSAGVRNFVIIAPGRTILNKTTGNFTPGGRKSLTQSMATKPLVITSDSFATPSTRAAMYDSELAKLYVFTVQALLEPRTKASRRSRKFQEGLGEAFYDHLTGLHDLVVFADEHHIYYGKQFSKAIRGLDPFALIGLTATPHQDTPTEKIIFRYPLANAIADRLVKTPVLVGRMDDRNDPETKLRDGVALLDAKVEAIRRYIRTTGSREVHPIMLVVCEDINQAKEVEELIASASFDGRFAGAVLRIDHEVPDASLAALADVEEPDSPVRIIVSVGMLKEGWDVANVYVIASLRPSISEILTEQTLGRGLRLPWGEYTDVELLDTLEVLAHERYEQMLIKAKALKEDLIDWRTIPRSDDPLDVGSPIQSPLVAALAGSLVSQGTASGDTLASSGQPSSIGSGAQPEKVAAGALSLVETSSRITHARDSAQTVSELRPRVSCGLLKVPVLETQITQRNFSLALINDMQPFRSLGRQLRLDPEDTLRRTLLSARPVLGRDGITRIELDTRAASQAVTSQGVLISPEQAKPELIRRIVLSPQVPSRPAELEAAEPLVDAFLEGLGEAVEHLGAYVDRATGGLMGLIAKAANQISLNPEFREVLKPIAFAPIRSPRPEQSADRFGEFRPRVGYRGWTRSMHDENWFDSRPERTVANALDASDLVSCWVRLLRNDLPILWNGMGRLYNPDFLVVEAAPEDRSTGLHWIIEVKSEKDLATLDVQAKRQAAEKWAATVTADPASEGIKWRYLLLGEVDIANAKGDWKAMRAQYAGR